MTPYSLSFKPALGLNRVRAFLLIPILFAVVQAQAVRTGEALLRAMHDRHASTWYRTLTFTQKSTTYHADGTSSVETWYEAASLPGKLRIDIGPPSAGNGYILVNGNVTIVKGNKVSATRHSENMLLVLGFDVYSQPPEVTAEVVKREGYDLSKLHEDSWEGKSVYVVGADKGDLKSRQFWVEKETLLFVREIEPAQDDSSKIDDIRFTNYRPIAGAWVAAGVQVYSEGRKVFSEDYSDIKANVKLEPAVFDPQQFSATHWER